MGHVSHTNSATHRQIYVVPTGGSDAVQPTAWIPVVTDFGIQPAWSSDSRGVYHFSLRDGSFCAWLQPIDPATANVTLTETTGNIWLLDQQTPRSSCAS